MVSRDRGPARGVESMLQWGRSSSEGRPVLALISPSKSQGSIGSQWFHRVAIACTRMWVHRSVGTCCTAKQNIATQSRQWRRARFQRLVSRCQAVGLNTSKVQLQKSPPQVRSTRWDVQRKGRETTGKLKMNQWLTRCDKISNQISSYCKHFMHSNKN